MKVNDEGMEAARAWAQWHLGSDYYADAIIDAYRYPNAAWSKLYHAGMERAVERGWDASMCDDPHHLHHQREDAGA